MVFFTEKLCIYISKAETELFQVYYGKVLFSAGLLCNWDI